MGFSGAHQLLVDIKNWAADPFILEIKLNANVITNDFNRVRFIGSDGLATSVELFSETPLIEPVFSLQKNKDINSEIIFDCKGNEKRIVSKDKLVSILAPNYTADKWVNLCLTT